MEDKKALSGEELEGVSGGMSREEYKTKMHYTDWYADDIVDSDIIVYKQNHKGEKFTTGQILDRLYEKAVKNHEIL